MNCLYTQEKGECLESMAFLSKMSWRNKGKCCETKLVQQTGNNKDEGQSGGKKKKKRRRKREREVSMSLILQTNKN